VAVRAERVPDRALIERVSPSATGLLLASKTVTSMVLVLVPSAVRFAGVAVTVSVAGGPAIKLTEAVPEIPPTSAVMSAEPTLVGLVRVAVAIPLVVVEVMMVWVPAVALSISPAVVEKVTVVPSAMLLPLVSLTAAVIRVYEVPLATISALPAVTVTEPTRGATRVIVTGEEAVPERAVTVPKPTVVEAV